MIDVTWAQALLLSTVILAYALIAISVMAALVLIVKAIFK